MTVNHDQGIKINYQCGHCEFLLFRKNAIKVHMTVNHDTFRRKKLLKNILTNLQLFDP